MTLFFGIVTAVCFVLTMGCVFACGRLKQIYQQDLKENTEAAFRRGTLRGLNIGWQHHGRVRARIYGKPLHGFSDRCHSCGSSWGIVQARADEYWECASCGHRNPAPLADADDAKPAAIAPDGELFEDEDEP